MVRLYQVVLTLSIVCVCCSAASAQDVDVYFIAGQSNAGNFGELNTYDTEGYNGDKSTGPKVDVGFNLDFARIPDRSSKGAASAVIQTFSSNMLDPSTRAVAKMAVGLNASGGNDLGIFSFGRNGRAIANDADNSADAGESWYAGTPGNDFNDELFGTFSTWSSNRLAELVNAGKTPTVKGIFWFQGEGDVNLGATDTYQTNFENLVLRFRDEFGNDDLAVVATEIREISGGSLAAQQEVNQALVNVAAADDNVSVIDIQNTSIYDPEGTGNSNVHLSTAGYFALADDYVSEMNALTVPEPSSLMMLGLGVVGLMARRRRFS